MPSNSDGSTATISARRIVSNPLSTPLCTNSQRPWRNGWQLVCCTGVPVVARMWARKSGDSMCDERSRRFASFHAGETLR